MSGQRNKKPSDAIKNRQEYLDNLSLEVQLNDANEQAVKQYVSTGQVPPISQMKDTRTTSQILADVEKLKINLIKDLEPVADPQFAQEIIARIVQSPLNIDNRLLIYTAQRVDELVKNLKKIYKYGIKGDSNDADAFVSYINKFYTENNRIMHGTKEFMNRLGSASSSGASGKLQQMHTQLLSAAADFRSLVPSPKRGLYGATDKQNRDYKQVFNSINTKFEYLLALIPSDAETLLKMEEYVLSVPVGDSLGSRIEFVLQEINHQIPNIDYIYAILREIYSYSNSSSANKSPEKIINLCMNLDSVLNVQTSPRMMSFALDTIRLFKREKFEYNPEANIRDKELGESMEFRDKYNEAKDDTEKLKDNLDTLESNVFDDDVYQEILRLRTQLDRTYSMSAIKPILERTRELLRDHGIEGRGINSISMPPVSMKARMSGKGLPRADYTQGIDPSPRYIKFGRYMINNKKLNDNVLSLRRSKGSTIATIPSTKMTSELGGVIKKIVGGGVPSFDELNKLTDQEKRYLFKVSQEADIYDKIKIPTPSKDEEEKDIHAFNVMKGEILAGNNSKELVAKFKALLNKLSKSNVLPKSQVREILEELLELGY